MSTSRLTPLKKQLQKLREAQDGVRLGRAVAGVLFWIAGTLAVWFAFDFLLNLSPVQRLLLMVISLPVLTWGISRAVAALRGWGASLIDTALAVEHEHGIDGDLVAALQFDEGQATGSTELQQAVVDYVAELKDEIDVFRGFDTTALRGRFVAVGLILVALCGVWLWAPLHLTIFFQRLALAQVAYPTRTQIVQVQVNGKPVRLTEEGPPVLLGWGTPLRLVIECDGVLPETCRLRMRDPSGQQVEQVLEPQRNAAGEFRYVLDRMIRPLTFEILAGDATSPPLAIDLVPLPALKAELTVTPPSYAQEVSPSDNAFSSHIAVVAGSDVSLRLVADRPLEQATLTLGRGSEETIIPLAPAAGRENTWTLPPETRALQNLQQTVVYQLTATDQNGLTPDSPLRGTIRVVPDRAPSATLTTIHHLVLPTAMPVMHYRASDDFGLASLRLRLEIRRGSLPPRLEEVDLHVPRNAKPPRTLQGEHPLQLAPFALQPGDRVHVTLEAADFRAEAAEPDEGRSETVHLEIGDEATVLAAIAEADLQSERMLSELIDQQLQIGESP